MRFSKIAVALLVCVALAFSTGCSVLQGTPKSISGVQIPENPNFRNTVWGMDRADVVKVERLKDSRGYGDLLGNKVQISDMWVQPYYMFDYNEKLYSTFYDFSLGGINTTECIEYYNDVIELYTQKYGEPDYNHPVWIDEQYKDRENWWGEALYKNQVCFEAEWNLPETNIHIVLGNIGEFGNAYGIALTATYKSLTYQMVEEGAINTDSDIVSSMSA